MSPARRPPERPGGGASRPASRRSGFRITRRGWVVVGVLVLVVVVVAGWAAFGRGSREGPEAAGTSPAATGVGTTAPSGGPGATTSPEATAAVAGLPPCRYAVLPAPDAAYGKWQRTLLDTTFALPQDFSPPDLVPVSEAGSDSAELVRSLVIPDLRALLRASQRAGTPVDVLIGYRSFARQQALFREHVRSEGRTAALATTARPGHSEHQLGTTIDFRTKGRVDVPKDWESQPAGAWMAANAWRFGFVMSYPKGREDVTCYSYEPWHYRYFGRALARRIHGSGLTPREYLWRMDSTGNGSPSPAPSGGGSA